MSDTFALPDLRQRIFSGVGSVRLPLAGMPANLRALALAAAGAAAVAGAMTWMQTAYVPAKGDRQAINATANGAAGQQILPSASSTYDKTNQQTDSLAGLRSDPTLRLDDSMAWSPAGGLSILTAPATVPNDRLAALPMPAPLNAAPSAPPSSMTAEADDVPLPRANPSSVAAIPMHRSKDAPAAVATAPEQQQQQQSVASVPPSGGFFGMLENFFTPHESRKATAILASNPRTAIYDISAHTVYMPNGEALEAHSGLGQWLDDPSSYNRKNLGVTPPNTYKISLRERLFHGVKALRLTPVGESRMYGRDGMLAHTYMLGPNGQSNGCVSFRDYEKFLQAYTSGEIDRLIVVPRLTTAVAQAS